MLEEALVFSIACTKLPFLFMQLPYSERIPDKNAISGCEIIEGK